MCGRRCRDRKACFRKDHETIIRQAYKLADHGLTPDAALIASSVGHMLDAPSYVYKLADYAIGLTPDRIAAHGCRVETASAARRLHRVLDLTMRRLSEQPGAVYNGAIADLLAFLEEIRRQDDRAGQNRPVLDDVAVLNQPEALPVIEQRILARTLVLVTGPSGIGKATLAIGAGLSIASNRPWLGAPIMSPGPMVFVAAESTPAPRMARSRRPYRLVPNSPR